MIAALPARANGCVMEAYAYLFHPQTHDALRLTRRRVKSATVRGIAVTFSFAADDHDIDRLTDHELAGRRHPRRRLLRRVDVAADRRPRRAALGCGGCPPRPRPSGSTCKRSRLLTFPGPVIAQLACAVALDQRHEIRVSGSRGELVIDRAVLDPRGAHARDDDSDSSRRAGRSDRHPQPRAHLRARARRLRSLIAAGPAAWERSWARSLATMRTLDRWRAAVGVRYDWE